MNLGEESQPGRCIHPGILTTGDAQAEGVAPDGPAWAALWSGVLCPPQAPSSPVLGHPSPSCWCRLVPVPPDPGWTCHPVSARPPSQQGPHFPSAGGQQVGNDAPISLSRSCVMNGPLTWEQGPRGREGAKPRSQQTWECWVQRGSRAGHPRSRPHITRRADPSHSCLYPNSPSNTGTPDCKWSQIQGSTTP